jgi:hypothetical protein
MSKAKAILQRIVDGDNRGDFFISNALLKEIEAILAQPEQKNNPLSEDDVDTCLSNAINNGWYPVDEDSYRQGFLDAGKFLG